MQRFGIHRLYRVGMAFGALALIIGLGVVAAFRAPAAHALLDACNVDGLSSFYDNYDTEGRIGITQTIQCSSSNARITGQACIWVFLPFDNAWHKTGVCWLKMEPNGTWHNQTLGGFTPCYKDDATWKYQGRASWNVSFPDGNHLHYDKYTTIRSIPCSSGLLIPPPGDGR